MEHRLYSRLAITLRVAVYSRGAVVSYGVCRNLSPGGMFVRMDPHLLGRNAIVEVELLASELGGRLRLPAMVVHRTEDGVGLEFDEMAAPHAMQLVRRFLHAVRSAQDSS